MNKWGAWISLFTSTGTLLCCALPSLLVALGMGASLAGLVSNVPQIVVLSQYKGLVFGISGLLILGSAYLQFYREEESCPIDPVLAEACKTSKRWSKYILIFSGAIWLVGAIFAFLLPLLG